MRIHLSTLTVALLVLAACTGPGKGTRSTRPYPLDTCLVTENALGSMGDPITKVYGDQEVKFCCRPCVAEFEADMPQFLERIPR